MDTHAIILSVGFMGGLGVALAAIIAVANRKLQVHEDPRIDDVTALLPGNNCGACGNPGCRAFAETLVAGKSNPASCTVSNAETKQQVASYLGIEVGFHIKKVARLACGGGNHVARQRTRYVGLESCRAAALVAGGGKGCAYGCLGLGDCMKVCTFGAITFTENGLPKADPSKCTGCGDCVLVCPKNLFSLQAITRQLWVNCKCQATGDRAESECEVACTTCGKCVLDAGSGLISMKNNLPVVDYTLNDFASPQIIQRCPTGAIGWINERNQFETGAAAKRVIRTKALPIG